MPRDYYFQSNIGLRPCCKGNLASPGVRVHKGFLIVFLLFLRYCFGVVLLFLSFCTGSPGQNRTVSILQRSDIGGLYSEGKQHVV